VWPSSFGAYRLIGVFATECDLKRSSQIPDVVRPDRQFSVGDELAQALQITRDDRAMSAWRAPQRTDSTP